MLGAVNCIASPGRGYTPVNTHGAAYNVTLTILSNNQIADNAHNDVVQVLVTDPITGLPVDNVVVSFTISGTTVSSPVLTGPASGFPPGVAQFALSSAVVGSTNVLISIGGVPVTGSPVTFTFIPGPPSTGPTSGTQLIVDVTGSPADGSTHNRVRAHITDANGNAVPGTTVVFTVSGGTASGTAVVNPGLAVTTNTNGDAWVDITNIKAGTVSFTATVNGSPITVGSPATVIFVASTPSTGPTSGTKLVVDVTGSPADGSTHNRIHAHITDANGNAVGAGTTVVFTVSGGTASGTAVVIPGLSVTTDANGDAWVDITNIKAGTVSFTATVNGSSITVGSPATVTFVAGTPSTAPTSGTKLVVDVTGSPADGSTHNRIHAHITDANGNAVGAGTTVVFTVSGGTASGTAVVIPGLTVTTDANGDAWVDITDIKAGTVSFTATVNGSPITVGSPATVTFVASTPSTAPTSGTMLVVDVTGSPADGSTHNRIHAHITDANGNAVGAGTTVVFTVSGGTASGTAVVIPGLTVTTDANGDAWVDITDVKAGTVSFTATVNGSPITVGSPATVTFVASTPSTASTSGTKLVVDVTGSVADGSTHNRIHAHITDANGNAVGAGTTVIFTVSGGTASGTAVVIPGLSVTTDANGDAWVDITDIKAGTVSFTATVNGSPITVGSPATVTFASGTPSPTGGKTQLTIVVDHVVADGIASDSLNAFITDANGNPVKGASVTFKIEAGGTASGTAKFNETVTVITDANGNAAIGLTNTVPGTVNVGAYVNGTAITGSPQMITFDNAPDVKNQLTQLTVVVYEAIANGLGSTVVKAHVVDLNGNPITGQNVVFTIDSGKAQIITPGPWTTDNGGDVSIQLTSTTPGFVLIKATVGGKPIVFGSPARVRFAAINIYVPRVFTPNGDGTNDILKPILVGIANFHYFNIYNRWGNLIFTTEDANQGWDGRFKGVPQPVETYLWIAEGIDINGNKIVQKGMVSLVR